ncbi:hypothetical protein GPECTOR_149g27 [Gonium pectorale]|uniref:Major facilitator superfamily (MFS) profile domain-containing protein n=1 Tax=Gonium pectorale TaxID=33097 RepID=A0A150FXW3_GONPE|nr:hypothetical protein GPECTOR_149g27 [Gonium pectorale]|eukprot:KXZ42417.1 hypothetical protein GPECTOR_149g27 [Gonium pectorale]
MTLGLTALFASQAPSYALSMWTVPPQYRPLSQAAIILLQHLLGDVPSPPVTGALHDATHEWRTSSAAAISVLGGSVVCFAAGALLAARGVAVDFREQPGGQGQPQGQRQARDAEGASGGAGGAGLLGPGVSGTGPGVGVAGGAGVSVVSLDGFEGEGLEWPAGGGHR